MEGKRKISCAIIAAVAILAQSPQTAAFSPSSSINNPNGAIHTTTKSWRGGTNNQNGESDLRRRTAKVSNFALSAASSPSAASAASSAVNNLASSAAPTSPMIAASNLAVSLDRPLLSPVEYSYRAPATKSMWSSFLAVLLSDVFKTALVAFVLAVGVSLVPKILSAGDGDSGGGESLISSLKHRMTSILSPLLPNKKSKTRGGGGGQQKRETYTQPMPFEGDGGWGKCTLRSKSPMGSSFTVYEFALPESYYTVPVALGQQLDLCCLSASDDICTGSFYPYNEGGVDVNAGVVRVVVPNDKVAEEGNTKFVSWFVMSQFICVIDFDTAGEPRSHFPSAIR